MTYRSAVRPRIWSRFLMGAALMAGTAGPAWADKEFEDCAVIAHSIASPFVQSRTQLSILNLESSRGNACNLVEFRIAEITEPPVVEMRDGIRRQEWAERWGVNLCGQQRAYYVWYREIGLGGISFRAEPEDNPPVDFMVRLATGNALSFQGGKEETAAGDKKPDSAGMAKVAAAAKENPAKETDPADAKTASLPPKAAAAIPPYIPRTLEVKKPMLTGHDVCAVQRALIGEGITVTVDGIYGPGMKKAVTGYQKKHGVEADGVVDADTREVLGFPTQKAAEAKQASDASAEKSKKN